MPTATTCPCAATISRRRWLGGAAGLGVLPWLAPWALVGCSTPPPAAPTTGAPSAAAEDYRFVNRLSWGATDGELDRLRHRGRAAYLDEQLRAAAGPLPAAAEAQIDALRVHQLAPAALWADIDAARRTGEAQSTEAARKAAQDAYQQALNRLSREAATRDLLRALHGPNQLLEQMQWFWFNHFNVHQYKSNLRVLVGDYQERALRPHALGRFRDLLGAATLHPAMLRYLDNEYNAVGRLNENHARELLELHRLGVDGGYSQRDVQELARVLTGHGLNLGDRTPTLKAEWAGLYRRDGWYEFNPARHDFGAKVLLGGTVPSRGAAELDEVLDKLAVHPATARFVSRKIAAHLLSDDPPARVVDAMTAAWLRSGGELAEVLGVLLRSAEFSAPTMSKFKDPVHYVVSAVRAAYGDRVVLNTGPIQGWLNRMGQGLYNRLTPDGYPANAAAWSSSGQLAARLDIARAIGSGSAGLFKVDDPAAPREQAAFPQLARPLYWQWLRPLLAEGTRGALDMATSPQDWNTLYLSAPEFMYL
jgi:uncharacterized protein (DUF1800 family)